LPECKKAVGAVGPSFALLEGVDARLALDNDALRASAEVVVSVSHPDYRGHFDERPVLPACSQFEIVEALAREAFSGTLRLAAVPRAKFLGIIEPGAAFSVEVVRAHPDDLDFTYSLHAKGKVYSRGKIRFAVSRGAPVGAPAELQ